MKKTYLVILVAFCMAGLTITPKKNHVDTPSTHTANVGKTISYTKYKEMTLNLPYHEVPKVQMEHLVVLGKTGRFGVGETLQNSPAVCALMNCVLRLKTVTIFLAISYLG